MKKDFLSLVGKHNKLTLVIIAIITCFFLYQASSLTLNGDYGSLLPNGGEQEQYSGGTTPTPTLPAPTVEATAETPSILETQVLTPSGNGHLLSADAQPFNGSIEGEEDYPPTTTYLVMVESKDLYTPENLTLIENTMAKLSSTRELGESTSLLSFVTMEKKGSRLMTVPFSPHRGTDPWTEEEAATLRKRAEQDPIISDYLVSEDLTCMLFSFGTSSLDPAQEAHLSSLLQPLRDKGIQISINGGAVINNKLMYYLNKDLGTLLGLCCLAILLVYYLSFRAKRSMLLPFSMSLIGIIWTLGTMKLLGYSLTIVNIVTPCMVLNLGSSYAIHVISEYYSDFTKGISPIESTRKILKTIAMACLTTVIGFLSLTLSKTPALREFGVAVGIGVTYCAILAATYIPALLTMVTPPKPHQVKTYSHGFLSKSVSYLSEVVIKRWYVFFLLWIVVIFGFVVTKDHIRINTNYMSYLPKKDVFGQSSRHFAQKMGGDSPFIVTIEAPEGTKNFFLEAGNLEKVYQYEQTVREKSNDIQQIISFSSYVSFANKVYSGTEGIPTSSGLMNLLSRMVVLMSKQTGTNLSSILDGDASTLNLIIQNYDSVDKDLSTISSSSRIEKVLKDYLPLLPDGTKVSIGGDPHLSLRFSNTLLADQRTSTYASYLLVFIVVLIAFKSLYSAFYSMIPILTGVMANYIFMYFLDIPFDMVTVSFASVAVGAGIDDAIHFLIRFREKQKLEHLPVSQMLHETIIETGRPIILTTLSIVTGMLMFTFASYTPIKYFGSLMAIALINCMLSTLLIMPAAIVMVEKLKHKFGRA
ncbi:putative RND superfamily exporter [Sphaerochaeta pleomorpha str. Grapes]|uniref:Putative RND superfamily exporter n=1 Tax=Sphaerochaeta pleomorpha (strain ATCC BAA-1885 / DSM 22778 / Grapes) TaxID=158190 RepID=G8QS39_SPHPG|nr:MMPL family transporter [Sphaerochaeta pleomorpha]AEV28900.1 putative RND superfamily exporter [Sphaerochaeta pleomorpha str. Grapes]